MITKKYAFKALYNNYFIKIRKYNDTYRAYTNDKYIYEILDENLSFVYDEIMAFNDLRLLAKKHKWAMYEKINGVWKKHE